MSAPRTAKRLGAARNQCAACGDLFGSVTAFERHRVGPFGTGPLGTSPARRCLPSGEISALGLERDESGFWRFPAPAGGRGLPERF